LIVPFFAFLLHDARNTKENPMLEPDRRHIRPSLLDPAACGEDLARMASRMSELAPALCEGCAAYHLRFVLTRCATADKSIAVDRPLLVSHVQRILSGRLSRSSDPLDVVIAGAADTGILATCAHAAAAMNAETLSRCRFTILDRCTSPLTLCQEFASRHALAARTVQVDLAAIDQDFDADVIMVHSLLRFLSRQQQLALLRKFDNWLRPGGRVILSQSIRPGNSAHREKEAVRWRSLIEMASAAVADGEIRIADTALPLLDNMRDADARYEEQPGEIASLDALHQLVAEAGLQVEAVDVISKEVPVTATRTFARSRVIAILKSSREN
jgi:SAM-dependent methyltransferase